jgi:hypothetical protein
MRSLRKLISGRMIDVWQNKVGTYLVHCPTPRMLRASARDWFYCGLKGRIHQGPWALESNSQFRFLRQIHR